MDSKHARAWLLGTCVATFMLWVILTAETRPAFSQPPASVSQSLAIEYQPVATATATVTPSPTVTLTPQPTPTPTPTLPPEIRLSTSPIGFPWQYLYDQANGKLFMGPNPTGPAVVFFDFQNGGTQHPISGGQQGRIHRGPNVTGEILFTVIDFGDEGRIWAGASTRGPLIYTLLEIMTRHGPLVRIHQGSEKGPILYTIRGDDMYLGPNEQGPLVYHGSTLLEGPVQFLLPLLADGRIP